ncbi:unnamed protein product [Symbiodinium necroappetens]|uniref:Uncharacterized protein n=1 Tax=Symbiodinium necroappetens TaxID=1628268 RepID=A0A813AE37_9DINO|nr:unnamed protein product [Symbiodinium necroappetens]
MVNNKKRKLVDAESVTGCLHLRGASETAVSEISSRNRPKDDRWSQRTFWRRVSDYYAPLRKCYCRLKLQSSQGSDLDFWVADAQAMLQHVVAQSAQWCSMLQAVLARTATLRVILYHDECTAGNVLSAAKKLKATMWYLSFQEFRTVCAREHAWLPVALLQHHVADAVLGGVSAATAKVLQHILQPANLFGFDLKIGASGGPARVQLAPTALFIADHDAQRATYCNKGSSGYKPCLWCANLLKRDAPQAALGSGVFVDICESKFSRFHIATDQEIFAAADHLADIAKAGERATMQKAYGFNFVPGSLLQDADIRARMPPSCASNDVLHAYYVNGVASWEVGLAMRELQSISNMDALRCIACSSSIKKPGLRIYKSHVAVQQKRTINESPKFQIAVLSRLLNVTLRESEEKGLLLPAELQKPFQAASSELRALTGDPELRSGKALQIGNLQIRPQDVILWDAKAAQVLGCFQGRSGFCVLTLRLQLLRKHAWGSVWQITDRQTLLPLSPAANIDMPVFSKQVGETISCLH